MNECHPVFSLKLQWNNFYCENPRYTFRTTADGLLAPEIPKLAPVPNFKYVADMEHETAASSWWFLYFNNDHLVSVHFFCLYLTSKNTQQFPEEHKERWWKYKCITCNFSLGKKRTVKGPCVSDSKVLLDSKYLFIILLGWHTVKKIVTF